MVEGPGFGSGATLRRLSQVAAVTSSSRLEDTLDWIVPMLAYYSTRAWKSADDWHDEILASYGIQVSLYDIGESLSRLVSEGQLIWEASKGEYRLSRRASDEIEAKIEAAGDLEERAMNLWFAKNPSLARVRGIRDCWHILMDYCAPVFRAHGIDAVRVITDNAPDAAGDTQEHVLRMVLDSHSLSGDERQVLRCAISNFFQSDDPEIQDYIAQIADSTFNLLALCVDEDSRRVLREGMPALKIFVDTNILFSILGTHDTPLAAASIDLFRVITESDLPFTLYYHTKTLSELTHTVENAAHRLRKQTWSSAVSRAIIRTPWQASRISGIEMRFHELNSRQQIDPRAFCARFDSPAALLAEHGLRIYRETDVNESQARLELRSTLIADYAEYLADNPRRRNANHAKLDHDCSVWMLSKDHQSPNRKGLIFSGSFFLSSDYALWKFDRDVLRRNYGSRPVVVLPDAFLLALRPFVGGSKFDTRAFVQAFSASEFRANSGEGMAATVRKVMSYLAAFEDISEETAVRMLSDSILLEGLKRYEESAPEFAQAIEKALFAQNEALMRERDELREEAGAQLNLARRALVGIGDGSGNSAVKADLDALVSSLEERASGTATTIINNGGIVNTNSGGVYRNQQTQVGAQGPNSSATGNSFTMQLAQFNQDPALVRELLDIKNHLLARAKSSDDYEVVAGVQGAIEALDAKDVERAVSPLRRAGQKALDVAVEIGAKVAAAAIQAQLGLGL